MSTKTKSRFSPRWSGVFPGIILSRLLQNFLWLSLNLAADCRRAAGAKFCGRPSAGVLAFGAGWRAAPR